MFLTPIQMLIAHIHTFQCVRLILATQAQPWYTEQRLVNLKLEKLMILNGGSIIIRIGWLIRKWM